MSGGEEHSPSAAARVGTLPRGDAHQLVGRSEISRLLEGEGRVCLHGPVRHPLLLHRIGGHGIGTPGGLTLPG